MIRAPADIDGISDGRNPKLHQVAGYAAGDGADEGDQRNVIILTVKADGFGKLFNRERAVGVDSAIAGCVRAACGVDQRLRGGELSHGAVDGKRLHCSGFTSASGSSVRISKIEIMGRMRTNRNMHIRNMPMVPKKVMKSQRAG